MEYIETHRIIFSASSIYNCGILIQRAGVRTDSELAQGLFIYSAITTTASNPHPTDKTQARLTDATSVFDSV